MSPDLLFVCKAMGVGKISEIAETGITPDMLFGNERVAMEFVLDFFRKYGKAPDRTTIETSVPLVLDAVTPEPLQFYADAIRKRWLLNVVGENLKKAVGSLERQDPIGAIENVKGLLKTAGDTTGKGILIDMAKDPVGRIKEYELLKALKGKIDGYSTPWPLIDETTRGMHKGEFWVILARLKTGKTWSLIQMHEKLWRDGHQPLFVSMEMNVPRIMRRWDALHAKLPFADFRAGKLTTQQEEKYTQSLKDMEGKHPVWVTGNGKVSTVADLEMMIEELKPGVVLIDGVYMMKSSKKDADKYQRVSTVVDDIQMLAQRKQVPIVVTSQFNRKQKEDAVKGASDQTGWAYEIVQNADVAIALFRNEELKAQKRMIMRMMLGRDSLGVDLMTEWDLEQMRFDEIGIMQGDQLLSKTTTKIDDEGIVEQPVEDGEIKY